MNPLKAGTALTKKRWSYLETIFRQADDESRHWLYYNGPLMWEFATLPDFAISPLRGVVCWADIEKDENGPTYKRVRYYVYEYHGVGFDAMKLATYHQNEFVAEWLQKADRIYAVDVCEHQVFRVLDARIVTWAEIPTDEKPDAKARVHYRPEDLENNQP